MQSKYVVLLSLKIRFLPSFLFFIFVNKPVAIGYNIVKNPDYDNYNLEKDGYIKHFDEDCVEWFVNEML